MATTYAAHPRQIPHLPIYRAERISTHVRSIPPENGLTSLNISAILPAFTAYRTSTALAAPHFPHWHKGGNLLLYEGSDGKVRHSSTLSAAGATYGIQWRARDSGIKALAAFEAANGL